MTDEIEKSYQNKVAAIKSDLTQYSKISILNTVLAYMESESENMQVRIMAHIPFLILKWSLISDFDGVRQMTRRDLLRILNRTFSLQSLASNLNNSDPFELKLRTIIKQQFATQVSDKEELLSLHRQAMWFTNSENIYFSQKFKEKTGLNLDTFFHLGCFLSIHIAENKNVQLEKFEIGHLICKITPTISTDELALFLKLVSIKLSDIPIFLKKFSQEDSPTWEFFQETPFIKKPLIQHGDSFYVVNKKLLSRSLSYFASDFLKQHFNREFKEHFGTTLEKYVNNLIEKTGIPFINEASIKKMYHEKQKYKKVVDFIIEDECRVFVDSKAIEPSEKVSTSHSPSEIAHQLESSYVKAIWQGQECCFNIENANQARDKENFLIVVVHQDHFFNNGTKIENELIPNLSIEISRKFGRIPIPLSNIYYLTIFDFERLVDLVSEGKVNLSSFLRQCRDLDSNSETSRMLFRMHIDCRNDVPNNKALVSYAHDRLDLLSQMITKNGAYWAGKPYHFLQERALLSKAL